MLQDPGPIFLVITHDGRGKAFEVRHLAFVFIFGLFQEKHSIVLTFLTKSPQEVFYFGIHLAYSTKSPIVKNSWKFVYIEFGEFLYLGLCWLQVVEDHFPLLKRKAQLSSLSISLPILQLVKLGFWFCLSSNHWPWPSGIKPNQATLPPWSWTLQTLWKLWVFSRTSLLSAKLLGRLSSPPEKTTISSSLSVN